MKILLAPFRFVYGWYRIFTHVVVHNGETKFLKSSTKAIRSMIAILAINLVFTINIVAMFKLFVMIKAAFAKGDWILLNNYMSLEILAWYVGLEALIGTLLGISQSNYSKHKQATVINQFKSDEVMKSEKTGVA